MRKNSTPWSRPAISGREALLTALMPSRASPLPQELRNFCGSGLARDAYARSLRLPRLDPRRGFGHQRVIGPVVHGITYVQSPLTPKSPAKPGLPPDTYRTGLTVNDWGKG